MLQLEKMFGNFFDDDRIIPSRLANFSNDVLHRLSAGNVNDSNTSLINLLVPAINSFQAELGAVDTARGLKKGKTVTVDQFVTHFKEAMRYYEGAISFALGGTKTPAYMEFYPNGTGEYSNATKTRIPQLLNRVKVAAEKYAGKIDPVMAGRMQEFETAWHKARNEQVLQIAYLSDGRTDCMDARRSLELVLLNIMHTIAARYPGNVTECMNNFNFSLLMGPSRKSKQAKKIG